MIVRTVISMSGAGPGCEDANQVPDMHTRGTDPNHGVRTQKWGFGPRRPLVSGERRTRSNAKAFANLIESETLRPQDCLGTASARGKVFAEHLDINASES